MMFCLKFLTAILLLITATAIFLVSAQPDQQCLFAVGDYRNCTCGVEYRIVEQRCCSSESCLEPILTTENLTCPFVCENGGTNVGCVCSCRDGYYGISCEREELCGDVFVEHSGEFTSLNFPNRYPNNLKCVWRISTDPNRRIALGTKDNEFDVEPGSNIYSCNYDRVRVHDGPDKSYRSLGTFCGNIDFLRTFKTVYSTGPHLYVEFSSDHIVQKKGYHLQYSVFFEGQECGPMTLYTRPEGTITSPQYPIQYRPKEECEWVIQMIPGRDVVLIMEEIDIPAQADCRYGDYLLVTGRKGSISTDLGVYCGTKDFLPYRINNIFDEIVLKFHSNRYIQGNGFFLTYEQIESTGSAGGASERYNGPRLRRNH